MDEAAFAAHAEACRRRGGGRPEHMSDLRLAWAAGRGQPAALRAFERLVAPDVEAAARRVNAALDDVAQALRVRLLVAENGRTRIDEYLGRGPLRGWVGVAALRVALNLVRGKAAATHDILGDLVSDEA